MAVNLKSLEIVIALASRKRDEAAGRVAQAQAGLAAAHAQMRQLRDYVHEGEMKWMARTTAGVSTALFGHQKQFASKIQHAMDFQTDTIKQREMTLNQTQAFLAAAERELATLEKVSERIRAQRAMAQNKTEQKHNDDMAMVMVAHQRHTATQEAHP
jgi:flagellar FliJ protein